MLINDYRKLDAKARHAAREQSQMAARVAGFGAAKLLMADAAEQIQRDWPGAVSVVYETNPHEGWDDLRAVHAEDGSVMWRSETSSDEVLDGAAHEIAQVIGQARKLCAYVLDETGAWQYVMWLEDWLTPMVDDPDEVVDGNVVHVVQDGTGLTAYDSAERASKARDTITDPDRRSRVVLHALTIVGATDGVEACDEPDD